MATHTIGTGGDYSTIQSWIDSLPATLTEPEVGQLLNQTFTISSAITFAGHATDATNTITLTTAAGASFRDNASKATNALRPSASYGAYITGSGAYLTALSIGSTAHVRLRGLQVDLSGAVSQCVYATGDDVLIDDCLLRCHSYRSNVGDAAVAINGGSSAVRNCAIVFDSADPGVGVGLFNAGSVVLGTTIVRPAAYAAGGTGIKKIYANACQVRGNAVFGFTSPVSGSTWTTGSDYNATDQSAVGTGEETHSLLSQSAAACLQDAGSTAASVDLRLKSGSPLIDAGASLTGVTDDAIGTSRPQGSAWDIGAWEVASAADTTPPTVSSAAVDTAGTTLTVAFVEAGSPPVLPASGATGFTLTASGGAATLSGWSISGTTGTATVSRAILAGETLTLAYAPGNVTDSATTPNALASFSGLSVLNNSTATGALAAGTASYDSGGPAGGSPFLKLTATDATGGTAPYSYQWRRSVDGGSYADVAGATTRTLTDTAVSAGHTYAYRLRYTDSAGTPATADSGAISAQVYTGGALAGGPATIFVGGRIR